MALKKDQNLSEDKLSKKKSSKILTEPEDNRIVRFQRFIEENRKLVLSISLGVIVLTALFFVYKSWSDKKGEENAKMASVALDRILEYYNKSDYQKSLYGDPNKQIRGQKVIGLLELINEYSGTEQADIAKLYAGNCYLGIQKSQEAIKYFDKALSSDSKMVQIGANAGLGEANEFSGNYKAAAENYNEAAKLCDKEDMKFRFVYFSGLCYEKIGDKKTAESKFRQILAESMYSEYSNYAKIGLTRLGTIIE